MVRYITYITTLILSLFTLSESYAQYTVGVSAGATTSSFRPYPSEETRSVTGLYTGGVSLRYYTAQRYVGALGIDVEFLQRGYSFAPYTYLTEEGGEDYYYTRKFNSIMVPFLWQPHIYMFNNHVRVFLEAAATFSLNLSSTYENYADKVYNDAEDWSGEYIYKTARDNRFGYGLMGGGGIAYIFGRWEIFARVRYYFGYSDILKNNNKYYTNNNDGADNPFSFTPTRSPVDNISLSFGVNFRLGKGSGFDSWDVVPAERLNLGTDFNYSDVESESKKSQNQNRQQNRKQNR